jgi:hypothetical protein
VTLAIILIASAACGDDPTPTAPIEAPAPRFAAAKELLVTNTSGGTGTGSLRWAASLVTGGEVIRFAPEIAGQTITLDATVVLANYATIEGPADKGITISGGTYVRVFQFTHQQGEVVLRNLTVTNGYSDPDGGAGIHSSGALRLEHSSVVGNSAPEAPALFAFSATLINSTVANNSAGENGGSAVATYGELTLIHSTVAFNDGGGVSSGPLVLHNSIIAKHTGGPNCVATSRTFLGNNVADDYSCGATIVADPMLGAGTGGPTPVYGLTPFSPAINAGADCTLPVDQRYVARDAQCDIGAFEFTDFSKLIALTVDPNGTVTENGSAVLTGTLRCPSAVRLDLEVELAQRQKQGRNTFEVSAATSQFIRCDTSVRSWSVELVPAGGTFQRGSAQAGAVTVNVDPAEPPASVAQAVKLSRSRK